MIYWEKNRFKDENDMVTNFNSGTIVYIMRFVYLVCVFYIGSIHVSQSKQQVSNMPYENMPMQDT